jgi:hypothetical protein
MTVLAERVKINKNDDVAGWNAANPLHPRSGDGRFSLAGAIAHLVEHWGEIVNHEQFGEEDHAFSDHGFLSIHDDGSMVISRVDDEGLPQGVAVLNPSDAGVLQERVEMALDELASGNHAPGTHLSMDDDDEEDPFPAGITYGVMSDGTRYVSIDDNTGNLGDEGLQLGEEHAADFMQTLGDMRDQQWQYDRDKNNPYLVRPLPVDETLMRRTKVTSTDADDVLLGIVDTPSGRRLRLGLGGGESLPERSFSGGPGPMVADLGPDDARRVDEAIDDVLDELAVVWGNQRLAQKRWEEWQGTSAGQRWDELTDEYDVYTGGDGQGSVRTFVREKAPGHGRREEGAEASAEIYAEVGRLQAEQSKIITDLGLVDDEGIAVSSHEVETNWGTLQFDVYQWDLGTRPNVRLMVRPKGTSAEDWDDTVGDYEAYANMTPTQLKKLRQMVTTAFQDASGNPITKSARAVATGNEGNAARLKRYWTKGKGLAKWIKSAHPWTTLRRHLAKYIKDPGKLDRTTSAWFHAATGMWSGERKGKNPVGPG